MVSAGNIIYITTFQSITAHSFSCMKLLFFTKPKSV